jgi:hypothetical protein
LLVIMKMKHIGSRISLLLKYLRFTPNQDYVTQ